MSRVLVAALAALVLASPALAADKVLLRSGSVVEGTIESHDADTIVVRSGAETLRIPQRLVDRVELGEKPAPVAAVAPVSAPPTPRPAGGAARATAPAVAAAGPVRSGEAASPDAPTAVDAALLVRLASEVLAERSAAMDAVVAGWPSTAGTLDAALRHKDASVRRDAVSLLGRQELGDTSARIRASLGDADPNVRVGAVRQVRNRGLTDVEPVLVRLLSGDASVMVRLEALRTLEEVGTAACLPAVLAGWIAEPEDVEKDRRRRYLRVLRKHTGEDAGHDRVANADAWRLAIENAAARKPGEKPEKPVAAGATAGPGAAPPPDAAEPLGK